MITLFYFLYLIVFVQLIYTCKTEKKGASPQLKSLNPNDLKGFPPRIV